MEKVNEEKVEIVKKRKEGEREGDEDHQIKKKRRNKKNKKWDKKKENKDVWMIDKQTYESKAYDTTKFSNYYKVFHFPLSHFFSHFLNIFYYFS